MNDMRSTFLNCVLNIRSISILKKASKANTRTSGVSSGVAKQKCVFWVWNCTFKLTHWGRVKHICVSKLSIIDSDNGLSPERRQAIIWTNGRILLIGPLGTNFGEILSEIHAFSFKKMHLKTSSAKRRPFCLGLNVLREIHFLYVWSVVFPSVLNVNYVKFWTLRKSKWY